MEDTLTRLVAPRSKPDRFSQHRDSCWRALECRDGGTTTRTVALLVGALMSVGLAIPATGCNRPDLTQTRPAPSASVEPQAVEIHIPDRLFGVPTGRTNALGKEERAACVTCHSLRRPERLPTSTAELDEFHQGLQFDHGPLVCSMCHVIGAQDTLHLADSTLIPMQDAMRLCAQCHGPQYRDYQHRSHGGLNGYWDRSQGAQVRNHCIDCHDPHIPRFQPSTPVLPPHDRGAESQRAFSHSSDSSHGASHGGAVQHSTGGHP